MGQAYKIDRLNLITYKCQKKKVIRSIHCRYLAKSHVVKCNAQSQEFKFVNFRGSSFSKTDFDNATFFGCDFWGTSFRNCSFQNTHFTDCVFMACRFKDCEFKGASLSYSTIVNTSLGECHHIDIPSSVSVHNVYPTCNITEDLAKALEGLKEDRNLKKNKLLFLSDTKYNHLNLYLLQKRYKERLPELLVKLQSLTMRGVTTYKKLERLLNNLSHLGIIKLSCPTQSRGCDANVT